MSLNASIANATFPYPPKPGPVYDWWVSLVVIAVINWVLFAITWWHTRKNLKYCHDKHAWSYWYVFFMRILAIPYVIECSYRSFLPGQYNTRVTIINSEWNSVLIERLLAFFGEISWGIQIGWSLRVISLTVPLRGSPRIQKMIRTCIPIVGIVVSSCAIIANISSCIALVSTNNAFSAAEESFWAFIFFLTGISSFILWHFGCDSFTFAYGANCFGYDINPFEK